MAALVEAPTYEVAADLCIIACHFNPSGFRSTLANCRIFLEKIRASGMPLVLVECAFDGLPFALPPAPDIVQVRARSVLFQKERLLNLALQHVPPGCTKIAWLDADLLFVAPDWATRTAAALDHVPIVQPFARAWRLPPNARSAGGDSASWPSFAAVCGGSPDALAAGSFDAHGHTGFAWAAQRWLLERHGLYDAMVTGNFDHVLAHAVFGDWNSACMRQMVGVHNAYAAHVRAWCRRFHADVRGRLGSVAGDVLHLWHGHLRDRRYVERMQQLIAFDFDPERDVAVDVGGALEWASPRPALHAWARDYFVARREDG